MADWERSSFDRTSIGKLLHALGTGERFGVRNTYLPMLEGTEAGERLRTLDLPEVYGGDVYRALRPKAGRVEGFLGGAVLGGLVDPLSYLGGGLTQKGLKAVGSRAAREVVPLAKQAERGERALLQLRIPGQQASLPLIRGKRVYNVLDELQQGKFLQQLPVFGPSHAAKVVDDFTTRLFQKFNVPVGVDLGFWRLYKNLLSGILGRTQAQATRYGERFEPQLQDLAERLVDYGVPRKQAEEGIRRVVTETFEANPQLRALQMGDEFRAFNVPYEAKGEGEHIARLLDEEFTNPAMGGPASRFDTELVRDIRILQTEVHNEFQYIYQRELDELGKAAKLVAHPDQQYVLHLLTDEARNYVRQRRQDIFRGPGRGAIRFPSSRDPSNLMRTMRWVDPKVTEENAELLSSLVVRPARGEKKEVTLYNLLKQQSGKKVGAGTLKFVREATRTSEPLNTIAGELLPVMSVKESNEWVWKYGLGDFVPAQTVQKWFTEDPTVLLAARAARAERAVVSREFFDELKLRPDLVVPTGQRAAHQAHWLEPANTPELRGYSMNPEAARWVNRLQEAEANYSKTMSEFGGVYRNITRWWKSYTLAIFPNYHFRNLIGNTWNYYLGSSDPISATQNAKTSIQWFRQGLPQMAKNLSQMNLRVTTIGGLEKAVAHYGAGEFGSFITRPDGAKVLLSDLYQQAAKQGTFGVGFLNPDDPGSVRDAIRRAVRYGSEDPVAYVMRQMRKHGALKRFGGSIIPPPSQAEAIRKGLNLSANSWFVESGFRVGQMMEDPLRFAHLIQKVREGHSIDDAILSVKKFFFDYHDLSPFEKNVMREVFPFYSWSRKNIPLQLNMLLTHPDRAARFGGGVKGFQGWDDPKEEGPVAEYLRKNYPLRVRKNKSGQWEYFILRNWLPLADVGEILHPISWMLQSLHPVPKVFLEEVLNTNFFTHREIDRMNSLVRGERTKMGPVRVPNKVAHIFKSFRPINALHQLIDNPQDLDMISQLSRLTAGRLYPLDPDRTMLEFSKKLEALNRETRRSMASAYYRNAGPDEVRRLALEGIRQQKGLRREYNLE